MEETKQISIKSFIASEDPLSQDIFDLLIAHREEDFYVDYKESFDPKRENQWLGITKDAMAFANTMGGYILFGVEDLTFNLIGLSEDIVKILTNTNMILQKLNRYVAPAFTGIRTARTTRGLLC